MENLQLSGGAASEQNQKAPPYQEAGICPNNAFAALDPYQSQPGGQHPMVQDSPPDFMQNAAQRSDSQFFHSPPEQTSMAVIPPDFVQFPTTSPTNTSNEFSHSMMGFENAYLPGDFSFLPSNSTPRVVGMAEGGVDWLNLELDSPSTADLPTLSFGQIYLTGGMQPFHMQPSMSRVEDVVQTRTHPAMATRFEQIRTQDGASAPANLSESQTAAHQWPFDHTRNPEPQKYRLPPLRDILHGTIPSNGQGNGNTIKSLIQLLSSLYLPEVDFVSDTSMLSALEVLKSSLDLYFTEFHAVLPVIHIPTFNMAKVPTVTLAAMSCIGAMYSDDKHGTEQSWSLSEMCIQMIAWLVSIRLRSNIESSNYRARGVPTAQIFIISAILLPAACTRSIHLAQGAVACIRTLTAHEAY